MFNVISAIFGENVMTASMKSSLVAKHGRLKDERLLASRLKTIMQIMLDHMDRDALRKQGVDLDMGVTHQVHMIKELEVSADVFDAVITEPIAIQALKDLDICEEDHEDLFEILDADRCPVGPPSYRSRLGRWPGTDSTLG